MIRYKCKVCGTEMESPEEMAGGWEPCPWCGSGVTVPGRPPTGAPGLAQPPPVERSVRLADQGEDPAGAAAPPPREMLVKAQARRRRGWGNIGSGFILIVMGLSGLFGGSIFTGDADVIDTGFDVLGVGLIVWGAIQLGMARAAKAKAKAAE